MIKLPNLDDQKYSDIVEAAKRRIPVICPEWTDFNEHDPGITIIELFAWLKEMQQYYLNRISDESYENMLRLLGIEIEEPAPARTKISFDNPPDYIMKGAQSFAADGTEFILEKEFAAEPFRIKRVFVERENGTPEVTDIALSGDTGFYPYGNRHIREERSLYLGLEITDIKAFYDGAELYFDIMDKCPSARNLPDENTKPPRKIVWEYSTENGFVPCEEVIDETLAMSFSGKIKIRAENIGKTEYDGVLPYDFYLRARLAEGGCEDMPLVGCIYTNGAELVQKTRESCFEDFILGNGYITVKDRLIVGGLYYVLVRKPCGWVHMEGISAERDGFGYRFDLSSEKDAAANDGMPNVRIVYCNGNFGRNYMFMSSNGLPCQRFAFDLSEDILTDSLRIMALDRADSEFPCWREYGYTDNLYAADPYDRCFTYDRKRREIVFGDNENGEIPPKGIDNIMVISCEHTRGNSGRVIRGNLGTVTDAVGEYSLTQHTDAAGGRGRETLSHAMARLKLRMNECVKAVTADDYRTLAMRTPGIRIADVCAIPFFDPDIPRASEDKLVNTVTLAVLPYSTDKYPVPDENFLSAVREYMENFRLITTQIKVVAPVYVSVDIFADVICGVREAEKARSMAEQALRNMFSVYGGGSGGIRFGKPVSDVDVITEICSVDGILSVKQIQINIEDSRCYHDKYGRIIIPPHAIVCCGKTEIRVAES